MKNIVKWTAVAVMLLLASCNGAPDPAFVRASRLTYDVVAPEYLRYVNTDPALDVEQKQRRADTMERWNGAIAAREVVK